MDGATSTFWQRLDLDRQITQIMQSCNLAQIVSIFTNGRIQDTLVLGNDFILGFIEELLLKISYQIILAECLNAEHDDFIYAIQSAHAWSKITDQLGSAGRKLLTVSRLVEIAQQHRVNVDHFKFSSRSFSTILFEVMLKKSPYFS